MVQGCNLNCTHCFTAGNRDPVMVTDLEVVRKFFAAIRKNVNPKKATFYLHGGETFLAPIDYMHKVCDLIAEIFNETVCIIIPQTNLLFKVDDKFIDFIRTRCDGELGVSWDHKIRFSTKVQEKLFWKNYDTVISKGINVAIAITVQKHLLELDPVVLASRFHGSKSIDFELLTIFNQTTKDLRVKNTEWAIWLQQLVEFYASNDVSWSLPQIDMFTKSLAEGKIFDCKCNCCAQRTFTLNPTGTMGLCPDKTYYEPISDVNEMTNDWSAFAFKALDEIVTRKDDVMGSVCYNCEFFEVCGGNCETELFWEGEDECPLSKSVIRYQQNHLEVFMEKLRIAKNNLIELQNKRIQI